MNKYKKLAFNTMIFAIGTFGSKILVLLLTRLYTAHISPANNYTRELLETMALFLWPIFTFALTEAVIRYGLDKKYNKKEVFSTASILTLCGLGLMALVVPLLVHIPFLRDIGGYTVLLIVYVCTSSIRSLCMQFVRARGFVKLFSLDGILATLTLFIFNITFIAKLHWGVGGYMLSVILSDFCSSVFLIITARLDKFFSPRYYSKKLASSMMRFSTPMIPAIVMWTITSLSDRIFISNMNSSHVFLGKDAAGLYGVANKVPNLISMVSTIFFQAWNMSAIMENDSRDRSKFYEKVYGAYESLLFIASAGLILFVRPISAIFVNSRNFAEYKTAYLYTPVLIIAVLFTCLDQFLGSIYTATKHTQNSFWTSFVACVVNLVLNASLIPEWGVQGAAIATFLSYYICFWARIIDARYYVPFGFSAVKSLANTAMLFVMCWCIISRPAGYVVWLLLMFGIICYLNYQAIIDTVKKIIKR
ncbi:MAG: polysaccharide biosynthesis C-terminal domain-containing protein [Ruminococcus sp.]|nr:polysaccharide biosynthesis C-terminal domain-containing protein [Ruminococcus sp.]